MSSQVFDIAVIGGGVVGCAVTRLFSLKGYKCILLEKEVSVAKGASSGNSGVFHSGFDCTSGTLEHECLVSGYSLWKSLFRNQLQNVSTTFNFARECGALVVAWNQQELSKLQDIMEKARNNGVHVQLINREKLRQMEPNLSHDALGAVYVPSECVVEPGLIPIVYLCHALYAGATLETNCKVIGAKMEVDKGHWRLDTTKGVVRATFVFNCAGNFGDLVDKMMGEDLTFRIKPRKGQFVVYPKPFSDLVRSIILPVPTERTKGVLVAPTIHGNLLVGPTAEDQDDREVAQVDSQTVEMLKSKGVQIVPLLSRTDVCSSYVGIRPATTHPDYQIRAHKEKNWLTVGGIRSTGLSAALGIAEYCWKVFKKNWTFAGRGIRLYPPEKIDQNLSEETDNIMREFFQQLDSGNHFLVYRGKRVEICHSLTRIGANKVHALFPSAKL